VLSGVLSVLAHKTTHIPERQNEGVVVLVDDPLVLWSFDQDAGQTTRPLLLSGAQTGKQTQTWANMDKHKHWPKWPVYKASTWQLRGRDEQLIELRSRPQLWVLLPQIP